MSRRVISTGRHVTVSRIEPGAVIEIYDRLAGKSIIVPWADMVEVVHHFNQHITEQQSKDVSQ